MLELVVLRVVLRLVAERALFSLLNLVLTTGIFELVYYCTLYNESPVVV